MYDLLISDLIDHSLLTTYNFIPFSNSLCRNKRYFVLLTPFATTQQDLLLLL
jgi:hypothetical protein